MSRGIKHIEFWVSNVHKSMTFYDGLFSILGWEKVSENGFKFESTKIYFKESRVLHCDSLGPRHICFLASGRDEVNKVGEFLQRNGYSIIHGPVEMCEPNYSLGYYTIDFRDPDGYILEVAHSPAQTSNNKLE